MNFPLTQPWFRREFVKTSVSARILAWITSSHQRRRIVIVAGPPGIGKSETLREIKSRQPEEFDYVKVSKTSIKGASPVTAMRMMAEGLAQDYVELPGSAPTGVVELKRKIAAILSARCGFDPRLALKYNDLVEGRPFLTVLFDEAQNLSREAIEALRFWNDPDGWYGPFPLGMAFVGNSEFSLRPDRDGKSPLSLAVADRASYIETFDYTDVSNDDLRMFLLDRGIEDSVCDRLVTWTQRSSNVRSLRRFEDAIEQPRDLFDREPTYKDLLERLRFT